jgi:serine/threonine protein kinase
MRFTSTRREVSINPNNILDIVLLEDFDVDKKIGNGSFGYVFLAKHKLTGKQFALKQLSKNQLIQKHQLKYALT